MNKPNPLHLKLGDRVITGYAEPACGPGWSNTPFCVIVENREGVLRRECLQPSEQSALLLQAYNVLAAMHKLMMEGIGKSVLSPGVK